MRIIQDGIDGYLVSTHEEWLQKILDLCKNQKLRCDIGSLGRKSVVDRFSVSANYSRYISILRSMVAIS
jgi:glycosyltransferase involved in cell wall biosynthesis